MSPSLQPSGITEAQEILRMYFFWSAVRVFWVTVNSKKLEFGPGAIYAVFPSSLGYGVGGQSSSNFLASSVKPSHVS